MMRMTGRLLAVLCVLSACGGQEGETPSSPPAPSTAPAAQQPPAGAPAAGEPQAAAKPARKVDPVADERRSGTIALREASIRTAIGLTPDQTAKLEKLGGGTFNIPIQQADLAYAVLTAEQHEKLRQEMARRAGSQVLSILWVQNALGLDETQRGKLTAVYQTQTAAIQQIGKKPDATNEEKTAEIMKLMASVQAASEAVLTPEQKQKLAALQGTPAQS
jgi:hypothetical protein